MKSRYLGTAPVLAALLLSGCFDFGKVYSACLEDEASEECRNAISGNGGSSGSGSGGVDGGDGGNAAGGAVVTAGGTTGGGGAGSGGTGVGGTVSSGGTDTGGTGGSSGGGRIRINELSSSFVEIFNAGTLGYDLTGHWLIKPSGGGWDFTSDCPLSGALPAGAWLYVQKAACSEASCLSCADFTLGKDQEIAVRDGSDVEVDRAVFDTRAVTGQTWQAHPDGGDDWRGDSPTKGVTNGPL